MKKLTLIMATVIFALCSFKPIKNTAIVNIADSTISMSDSANNYQCPCHPLGDIYYYNCPCTHFNAYGNPIHAYDICQTLVPCVHTCYCQ